MALFRCEKHSPPYPNRTKKNYVRDVSPIGFPNTSAICGKKNCNEPGCVWLIDSKFHDYNKGRRIFELNTLLEEA